MALGTAIAPVEELEPTARVEQQELDNALKCLRAYQAACKIPLLPEEEERALLEWIVKGGRLPEHLNLDEK